MTTTPTRSQALAAAVPAPLSVPLPTLSVGSVLPWLALALLVALVALYFVSAEQGASSLLSGTAVHEWVHDGRHLLGFPCH